MLLLSRFSRVQLCATPETAAHQAPPSLGFSRQEHWSELPFPSPMHEKMKSESEVVQSCLTLCDPIDSSLPGSSVHGIFQARVLEWVAIVFYAQKDQYSHKFGTTEQKSAIDYEIIVFKNTKQIKKQRNHKKGTRYHGKKTEIFKTHMSACTHTQTYTQLNSI